MLPDERLERMELTLPGDLRRKWKASAGDSPQAQELAAMKSARESVALQIGQSPSSVRRKVKKHIIQAAADRIGPIAAAAQKYWPAAAGASLYAGLAPFAAGFAPGIAAGKALWTWRGNVFLKRFAPYHRVGGITFYAPTRAAEGLIAGTKGRGAPWSRAQAFKVLNSPGLFPLKQAATSAWAEAFDLALARESKGVDGSVQAKAALDKATDIANKSTLWVKPYFQQVGEALRRGEPALKIPTDQNVLNEMRTGLYAPRTRKRWSEGPAKMYPRGVNNKYYRMTLMYPPGTFSSQGKKLLDRVPKTFQGKPVRDVIGVKAYDSLLGAHIYRARGGSWKKIGVVNFETKEQRDKRQREARAKRQAETKTGKRPPSNGDALGAEIAGASNTTKALMAVVAAKLIGLF